jgi:hypothetical protein
MDGQENTICYGLGCFNFATNGIKEDGYDGVLLLCDDCITKFPKAVTQKSWKLHRRYLNQHRQYRVLESSLSTEG